MYNVNYTDHFGCYVTASVSTDDNTIVDDDGREYYLYAMVELRDHVAAALTIRIFVDDKLQECIDLAGTSFMRINHTASKVLPFNVYCEADKMLGQLEDEWYKSLN